MTIVLDFLNDEAGATAIEYGLIASLVALLVLLPSRLWAEPLVAALPIFQKISVKALAVTLC